MKENKVSVKIYGQEYIISGEKGREQIVKVGAYVDNRMHEIANVATCCSVSELAVLAAVNIADECFEQEKELDELRKLNVQLEKDAQHYVQLWDESKKAYAQYKEETQAVGQLKDELMQEVSEKDQKIREMEEEQSSREEELSKNANEAIGKAEARCRELENSFFDLQMENLQLKKAVETYKHNAE